ncbi:SH3 domain-containing protein [Acuticoccus sp.]|uniref:SH3 domain-containing protein n=1 Tax=Acuticoccus sp. TaxID=1904378 RepID=UPI003B52E887
MRTSFHLARALFLALMVLARPALAADLARPVPILPPPPPPAVTVGPHALVVCLTGAPVRYSRAPGEMTVGSLPAGVEVAVIDAPFDPRADLWVRIKAPYSAIYYGWVYTRTLVCH